VGGVEVHHPLFIIFNISIPSGDIRQQNLKLSKSRAQWDFCVSTLASITFCQWTKVHQICFDQSRMGCTWSFSFPIFVMLIRSGDISDQIRMFSEIAPIIDVLCTAKFCWMQPFQKLYPHYRTCLKSRRPVKFRETLLQIAAKC